MEQNLDSSNICTCKECGCELNRETDVCVPLYKIERKMWRNDIVPTDKYVCSDCTDNVAYCEDCDTYFEDEDDVVFVEDEQKYVCLKCADNDYYRCDCCGNIFSRDGVYTDDYDNIICYDCYDSCGYVTCSNCGRLTRDYSERRGEYYCDECYDDMCDSLHEYGYKPEPVFHFYRTVNDIPKPGTLYTLYTVGSPEYRSARESLNKRLFYGVELEMDNGDDVEACAQELSNLSNDEDLFYLKEDGSLNDGIELVTHPCSFDYITKEFPWERIVQIARAYDFLSHSAGTCGLHVHVTRNALGDSPEEIDLNIAKMMLFFDKYWDQLVKFARRDYSQLERWAKKPSVNITSSDSDEAASEKGRKHKWDRYYAINITNYSTVEFRLFRGTLKVDTIKATLQFLDNLIAFVKKHSLHEMLEAKFLDVMHYFEHPELNAYLTAKGLNTEPPVDSSVNNAQTVSINADRIDLTA